MQYIEVLVDRDIQFNYSQYYGKGKIEIKLFSYPRERQACAQFVPVRVNSCNNINHVQNLKDKLVICCPGTSSSFYIDKRLKIAFDKFGKHKKVIHLYYSPDKDQFCIEDLVSSTFPRPFSDGSNNQTVKEAMVMKGIAQYRQNGSIKTKQLNFGSFARELQKYYKPLVEPESKYLVNCAVYEEKYMLQICSFSRTQKDKAIVQLNIKKPLVFKVASKPEEMSKSVEMIFLAGGVGNQKLYLVGKNYSLALVGNVKELRDVVTCAIAVEQTSYKECVVHFVGLARRQNQSSNQVLCLTLPLDVIKQIYLGRKDAKFSIDLVKKVIKLPIALAHPCALFDYQLNLLLVFLGLQGSDLNFKLFKLNRATERWEQTDLARCKLLRDDPKKAKQFNFGPAVAMSFRNREIYVHGISFMPTLIRFPEHRDFSSLVIDLISNSIHLGNIITDHHKFVDLEKCSRSLVEHEGCFYLLSGSVANYRVAEFSLDEMGYHLKSTSTAL